MIRVVTTFSRKNWDEYVHKTLPETMRLWPKEIDWQIWLDAPVDWTTFRPAPENNIRWLSIEPEHEEFMRRWKTKVEKNKDLHTAITAARFPHGWTYDAGTFAHKVFAMTSQVAREKVDYMIFLDGDVETHEEISLAWLNGVLGNSDIVYLGRKDMRSADTAFLAFRTWKFPGPQAASPALAVLDALRHVYTTEDIYNYGEWVDGHVLARLAKIFQGVGLEVKNLSEGVPGLDVFEHTVLGQKMRHHKGPRGKAELMQRSA